MASLIPDDPNTLLRRKPLSEALARLGYPVAEATLATWATRPPPDGDGPPFQMFGRIPLYRWGNSVAWAEGRLSPIRRTTSEIGDQRSSGSHYSAASVEQAPVSEQLRLMACDARQPASGSPLVPAQGLEFSARPSRQGYRPAAVHKLHRATIKKPRHAACMRGLSIGKSLAGVIVLH